MYGLFGFSGEESHAEIINPNLEVVVEFDFIGSIKLLVPKAVLQRPKKRHF